MRFDILDFEWDEHNEDKIYDKHGVTAEEAEEVSTTSGIDADVAHRAVA